MPPPPGPPRPQLLAAGYALAADPCIWNGWRRRSTLFRPLCSPAEPANSGRGLRVSCGCPSPRENRGIANVRCRMTLPEAFDAGLLQFKGAFFLIFSLRQFQRSNAQNGIQTKRSMPMACTVSFSKKRSGSRGQCTTLRAVCLRCSITGKSRRYDPCRVALCEAPANVMKRGLSLYFAVFGVRRFRCCRCWKQSDKICRWMRLPATVTVMPLLLIGLRRRQLHAVRAPSQSGRMRFSSRPLQSPSKLGAE